MTRFAELPTKFVLRRSGSPELTAHEQATVLAARRMDMDHRYIATKAAMCLSEP